jgi:hypothetical protein
MDISALGVTQSVNFNRASTGSSVGAAYVRGYTADDKSSILSAFEPSSQASLLLLELMPRAWPVVSDAVELALNGGWDQQVSGYRSTGQAAPHLTVFVGLRVRCGVHSGLLDEDDMR